MKITKYIPKKPDYELLSDCCYAPPMEYGIFGVSETIHGITGFCSRCKDGSGFEKVYEDLPNDPAKG